MNIQISKESAMTLANALSRIISNQIGTTEEQEVAQYVHDIIMSQTRVIPALTPEEIKTIVHKMDKDVAQVCDAIGSQVDWSAIAKEFHPEEQEGIMKIQTIPTHYTIGDKPWLMASDNRIVQGKVVAVHIDIIYNQPTKIEYTIGYVDWGEYGEWRHGIEVLYDTKEELISTL